MTRCLSLLLAAALLMQSCTYTVTGADVDSNNLAAAVQPDPNLTVTGLELFQRTIETESLTCTGIDVALDYRDHAFRLAQASWQNARRRGLVGEKGTLNFDALDVRTACETSGWGLLSTSWSCASRAELAATFTDSNSLPVAYSAHLTQQMPMMTCGDTSETAQLAVDGVLANVLQRYFGGITVNGPEKVPQ